jgi:hypothetical protein
MMRLAYEHSAMAAGCVPYEGGWRHHGKAWKRGERILNPYGIDCDYNLMENECRNFKSLDTVMLLRMCSLAWEAKQGTNIKKLLRKWWKDGYRMDRLKDEPLSDDLAWDQIRRLERSPLVATP